MARGEEACRAIVWHLEATAALLVFILGIGKKGKRWG
jgi:hypothetical protein